MNRRIFGAAGLAPVLALAVAVAVTACSGGSGSSGSSGSSAKPSASASAGKIGGSLKVYSNASSDAAIEQMAKGFEAAHPGVTIDVTSAATDVYMQTLATQMSSGTAADVVFAYSGYGGPVSVTPLAKAGRLMDLSNQPWVAKIPKQYRSVNEYKGRTYVVPAVVGAIGSIYNTATLKQLGVQIPKTFSDVEKLCAATKAKGIPAFALGLQTPSNGIYISYALAASLTASNTNEELAAKKTTFAKSGWNQVLTEYMKLNSDGCFQKNPLGTSSEQAYQEVANGQALATVAVNGALSQIESYNPHAALNLFPLPATNSASDLKIATGSSGTWAVNAKTRNPGTAVAFVNYIANHEAAYAAAAGGIPMDPSQLPKDLAPALAAIAPYIASGKVGGYPDQTWPGASVSNAHIEAVQNLFAGTLTVKQALQQMQSAYDSAPPVQ